MSPRSPWHKGRLRNSNQTYRCMKSPMTIAISLRTTRTPTHMSRQELGGSATYIRVYKGAIYGSLTSIRFITEIRCADPRSQSLLQPRGGIIHVDRRRRVPSARSLREHLSGCEVVREHMIKWSRSLLSQVRLLRLNLSRTGERLRSTRPMRGISNFQGSRSQRG